MKKQLPREKPQPPAAPQPAPRNRKAPRVNILPPDALKRSRKFYKDSFEIERQWWRITN